MVEEIMKTRSKVLKIVSPVGADFLASVCKHIYEYFLPIKIECEVCGNKFPLENVNMHKDFFICNKCCKEKELIVTEITVVTFDLEEEKICKYKAEHI